MQPWSHPFSTPVVYYWGFFTVTLGSLFAVPAFSDQAQSISPQNGVGWDETAGAVQFNINRAVASQFTPLNRSHAITHLAVDPNTDDVYVGAVNRLYQLDGKNLVPVHQVVTGPRLDSPQCHASSCGSHIKKILTDNYNKLLVVAPSVNAIVACGSVSQGACDKYTLGNVSLHLTYIPRSVAANDPNSSTFAFVGPERHNWGESEALYVGTTFTNVGDYRHDVPALSTRNLFDLDYSEFSFSKQSLLRIDVKYRDNFLVHYVFGFNTSHHVYFLMVQKKSHLPGHEESGYVTRISRSCISDPNYDSYTEITLECLSTNSTNYNLIQDAKVVSAGSDLAASLGVSPGQPVLLTAFSPSQDHTATPQATSAMCVYSVKDIEQKFNENIHMCFNGSMQYRNLEYISGPILDGKCLSQGKMGNIHSFCEVGLKISGPSAVIGTAALHLPQTLVTAVQATATGSHTVAFLGSNKGEIKKILVKSWKGAAEYETVPVDPGHPILPDLTFSRDKSFLYVISSSKVSKVRVESCGSYNDCSSCLAARDPYCGWCSLEKRCTIQSSCQKATFSSPRWLSFSAGQQCIDFEMIIPDRLPITHEAKVQLTIRTLPSLPSGAKYQCVWGTSAPTDALMTSSGLTCDTPPKTLRPAIPPREDHVLVSLAVRSSETNKDFVSRNFAFYDCGKHTTCSKCVKSSWACNWCIYENLCTHNASSCRRTVISGENNPSQLVTHGVAFCPKFWKGGSELLAADASKTELLLRVENLPRPRVGQLGFQCVVTVEGATMVVGARVGDEFAPPGNGTKEPEVSEIGKRIQSVLCEPTVYRYESPEGEYQAHVTLVWNRDHVVDTRLLTLYKCGVLGSHRGHQDCSLCVTRPLKYQCAWCGGLCKYTPHCPASVAPLLHALTRENQPEGSNNDFNQCPTPRIDVIQPLAGPVEGGTLVTIEGSNLGLREEDIKGRVFIGDIPCWVRDYQVSVKIICRTGPVPLEDVTSGTDLQFSVKVSTPAGSTESTVKFTYTNVTVTDVWPKIGPSSGGTMLSISGQFLNVGSDVSVTLDELPCVVNKTQSSSHRITCVTNKATPLHMSDEPDSTGSFSAPRKVQTLVVAVDGAKRFLSMPFTYIPDPQILELKPLKSPWSGGRLLTVHGMYLHAVVAPKITVLFQDRVINSSVCRVIDSSLMECPSPVVDKRAIVSVLRERRALNEKQLLAHKVSRSPKQNIEDSYALDVGFIMDNVVSVKNLKHSTRSPSRTSIIYVPDPKYSSFPNNMKLYKGDTLVIEGENLNLASDETDLNVTVGTKSCNVTSLALTQMVCTPPDVQPLPTDELGHATVGALPLVVVRVGKNLRFPIGFLRYEMEYQFPPEAIGGMAAGGLFLVLVSMVILVIYRRKSNQAEREYKRIQIQMDTLESNVRSECKQAFAELQTDMTDLTADLESSGIPTLDHRNYVLKVFFPGVSDHPALSDNKVKISGYRPNSDSAMVQLEQLLTNRYFFLTLIETLESQKSFNMRDKVSVASLLVVALTGRMEYLTEILRLLLLRLIDRSVAYKHPQLMLRRTESVVEKMLTNWLALCMYGYLKECIGPSLFLLFKAIKHQVEKGPVDHLTHDARYSLSEERLLREQVPHSTVTIHLVKDEPHYEKIPYTTQQMIAVIGDDGEKASCKVLDCDTISQVKSKVLDALYRNTPNSLRPTIQEVDLGSGYSRSSSGSPVSLIGDGEGSGGFRNRIYHLVKPVDHDSPSRGGERTHKAIPEIFLTRLLSTKGTVQKFVDDFFRTILSVNSNLPPAVKWLFDFLDDSARRQGITDPDVVLSWKSNSLPLRFWVNFIKNPDFILDINKSPIVDSCLSVVAQTFMDACSTSEHRLGKDSPSNKLLFAKDMPRYKTMVRGFYQGIKELPIVTDQDMAAHLHQLSLIHLGQFDPMPALHELFHSYIIRYYPQIMEALEMDIECRTLHISHKLENVMCTYNGESTSMC